MRVVTKSDKRTPIRNMIRALDWLTFSDMINYAKVMLLYKLVLTQAAPFCKMLITRGIALRNDGYQLRERELRIAWDVRYQRRAGRSFLITATKVYNHAKLFGKVIQKDERKKYVRKKILSWRPY